MIKWLYRKLMSKNPIKKHWKIRRVVYSSDDCRVDKKGGPYEVIVK